MKRRNFVNLFSLPFALPFFGKAKADTSVIESCAIVERYPLGTDEAKLFGDKLGEWKWQDSPTYKDGDIIEFRGEKYTVTLS